MVKPSRSLWLVLVVALGILCLAPKPASAAAGAAPPNLVYVAVTPCRMVNTGLAGGPLIAGTPRTFTFRGLARDYTSQGGSAAGCGIPDMSGGTNSANLAKAVAVNIFAVSPASDGDLRAWPSNLGVPLAAVLTYAHVGTLAFANGVILPMCSQIGATACPTGDVTFRADFGNTNLIVDVVGYFTEGTTLGSDTNVALGHQALQSNTTGTNNVAAGFLALRSNSSGNYNTALGTGTLEYNSTGSINTGLGEQALRYSGSGLGNTAAGGLAMSRTGPAVSLNSAFGALALENTQGSGAVAVGASALLNDSTGAKNTALGSNALYSATTGSSNIGIGYDGGRNVGTGSNNIEIGNVGGSGDNGTIRIGTSQTQTFIAGISGSTSSGGVAVFVNSSGQLGTTTSSRRFKEDIRDLGDVSERIFDLRPVSFRYKAEVVNGDRPTEFGLIAEEVERTFPELVVYGKDGLPQTVKYHLLVPLLLNELQKEHSELLQERAARARIESNRSTDHEELIEQRRALTEVQRRLAVLQAASGPVPHP